MTGIKNLQTLKKNSKFVSLLGKTAKNFGRKMKVNKSFRKAMF